MQKIFLTLGKRAEYKIKFYFKCVFKKLSKRYTKCQQKLLLGRGHSTIVQQMRFGVKNFDEILISAIFT